MDVRPEVLVCCCLHLLVTVFQKVEHDCIKDSFVFSLFVAELRNTRYDIYGSFAKRWVGLFHLVLIELEDLVLEEVRTNNLRNPGKIDDGLSSHLHTGILT